MARVSVRQRQWYKKVRAARTRIQPRMRPYLKSRTPTYELKVKDVNAGTAVIDSTGEIDLLNGIARGDDISERVGRAVTMRSLQIRAYALPTATTGTPQDGRMILFYDK